DGTSFVKVRENAEPPANKINYVPTNILTEGFYVETVGEMVALIPFGVDRFGVVDSRQSARPFSMNLNEFIHGKEYSFYYDRGLLDVFVVEDDSSSAVQPLTVTSTSGVNPRPAVSSIPTSTNARLSGEGIQIKIFDVFIFKEGRAVRVRENVQKRPAGNDYVQTEVETDGFYVSQFGESRAGLYLFYADASGTVQGSRQVEVTMIESEEMIGNRKYRFRLDRGLLIAERIT
ncbi:MAG: hypothetical protein WC595_00990, partial [Candidatus Nanoarchaeia archaeon]